MRNRRFFQSNGNCVSTETVRAYWYMKASLILQTLFGLKYFFVVIELNLLVCTRSISSSREWLYITELVAQLFSKCGRQPYLFPYTLLHVKVKWINLSAFQFFLNSVKNVPRLVDSLDHSTNDMLKYTTRWAVKPVELSPWDYVRFQWNTISNGLHLIMLGNRTPFNSNHSIAYPCVHLFSLIPFILWLPKMVRCKLITQTVSSQTCFFDS